MSTRIVLTAMPTSTRFAPLGALGYCLTRTGFLDVVFNDVELSVKRVDHAPQEKLLDGLVAVLAGCRAIYEINARVRPDRALAQAWGRDRFAEQSNVSRALDAFTATPLEQLQQGSKAAIDVMEQSRSSSKLSMVRVTEAEDALQTITAQVAIIDQLNAQIASATEEQSAIGQEIHANLNNITAATARSTDVAATAEHAGQSLSVLSDQLKSYLKMFQGYQL